MAKAESIEANPTQDTANDQACIPHAKDIFAPEDVAQLEQIIAADCWSEPMTVEDLINRLRNNKPMF